jgi:hypothetical protein
MRFLRFFLFILAGLISPAMAFTTADSNLPPHRDGVVLMQFQDNIPANQQNAILTGVGASIMKKLGTKGLMLTLYYVCRKAKAGTKCDQQPVAAVDLEPSLIEQMEQSFGSHFDRTFVPRSFGRISYDSRTREVQMTLVDGSQFGYTLPPARRPGVRRSFEERQACGRVPRVSRLMALALRFQDLLSQGTARNHSQLAQPGTPAGRA